MQFVIIELQKWLILSYLAIYIQCTQVRIHAHASTEQRLGTQLIRVHLCTLSTKIDFLFTFPFHFIQKLKIKSTCVRLCVRMWGRGHVSHLHLHGLNDLGGLLCLVSGGHHGLLGQDGVHHLHDALV